MNYRVINDEKLFRDFINWLPETEESEKYYVCLFARTKYCKEIVHVKSDKQQLKRFTSRKKDLYEKIWQLEVPFGAYTQKGVAMPQEALALYITPNPRNEWKAMHNAVVKLAMCLRDDNYLSNPVQEVMSEVHKAKSRTCWIDFDVDFPDNPLIKMEEYIEQKIEIVQKHVNLDAVQFLRSRGGLHVLVDPKRVEEQYKRTFFINLKNMVNVDQTGDNMIPVVGCTQGNFTPYFINYEQVRLENI